VNPDSDKPRSLIFVKTPGEKLENPYPQKGIAALFILMEKTGGANQLQ
jgi:hypothetical protein